MSRKVIKVAGESGGGIESTGSILMKSLKKMDYYIYAEREFPSLIKGGRANMQINFDTRVVRSMSKVIDIAIGMDREGVLDCLETLKPGGVLIHGFDKWPKVIKNLPDLANQKGLQVFMIPARELANSVGGSNVMVNTVLLGFLWKKLELEFSYLSSQISEQFVKKPQLIPTNLECARVGYEYSGS